MFSSPPSFSPRLCPAVCLLPAWLLPDFPSWDLFSPGSTAEGITPPRESPGGSEPLLIHRGFPSPPPLFVRRFWVHFHRFFLQLKLLPEGCFPHSNDLVPLVCWFIFLFKDVLIIYVRSLISPYYCSYALNICINDTRRGVSVEK